MLIRFEGVEHHFSMFVPLGVFEGTYVSTNEDDGEIIFVDPAVVNVLIHDSLVLGFNSLSKGHEEAIEEACVRRGLERVELERECLERFEIIAQLLGIPVKDNALTDSIVSNVFERVTECLTVT